MSVGGDQLTRVRLQEAKNLRTLSVTPEKRYDELYPIVCEMWHSKQDFLEVGSTYIQYTLGERLKKPHIYIYIYIYVIKVICTKLSASKTLVAMSSHFYGCILQKWVCYKYIL